MTYKDAFFDPSISWAQLIEEVQIPKKLYKYQSFYTESGLENQFWMNNMQGEFHLSLGSEFEDANDCKPYICKADVKRHLHNFLKSMNEEQEQINSVIQQFETAFNENSIERIVNNYQSTIRIGCFTDSFKNDQMWSKYATCYRGYCIEYDTSKAELFTLSMLPVLYIFNQYNLSISYANSLILECCRQGKKRSEEEQLEIYKGIYEKISKITYIPIFLKNEDKWSFEKEYRMFILNNRTTKDGVLRMKDVLDEKHNINLSKAVKAIYLGKNFYENENADILYDKLLSIQKSKTGMVFDIYKMNQFGIAEKQA
jgi:hypothetical protein